MRQFSPQHIYPHFSASKYLTFANIRRNNVFYFVPDTPHTHTHMLNLNIIHKTEICNIFLSDINERVKLTGVNEN